jgi:hypothetical protein
MLRALVVALGVVLVLFAAFVALTSRDGWPASIGPGIFGLLILVGTLLERRYRSTKNAAGTGWQSTGERFIDPTSGKLTEVRYNPQTGERAYVIVE